MVVVVPSLAVFYEVVFLAVVSLVVVVVPLAVVVVPLASVLFSVLALLAGSLVSVFLVSDVSDVAYSVLGAGGSGSFGVA